MPRRAVAAPKARRRSDYAEFARAIREELRPRGVLEDLIVGRIAMAAWELATIDLGSSSADGALRQAIESLEILRAMPCDALVPPEPVADDFSGGTHDDDRLDHDADEGDGSPVVRGTWITVDHVVSLILDGWSWADILRSHPELDEADIRACLDHATRDDDSSSRPRARSADDLQLRHLRGLDVADADLGGELFDDAEEVGA